MTVTRIKTTSLRPSYPKYVKRLRAILGPDWLAAYSFMVPSILLMAGVIALPFFLAFFLSFTNTHTVGEIGPFVGLRNYVVIWEDHFFRTSVWITVKYTFWSVLFKVILGVLSALLLHRLKRFSAAATALLLLPWIMPEVVRATTWKGLLDPLYGIVNRLLLDLGLIERTIPFFGEVKTALGSVILVNVWAGFPLVTIIILAGLKSIDQELYEAAAIDGAGAWRKFLHVTLPALRYVIIISTLLSTIWSFNEFTPIFVMTRGGPLGSTTVYTIRVYEAARNLRFGVGVAMGMTLFPVLGVLILLLSRYMIIGNRPRDETSAAPGKVAAWLYRLLWPFQLLIKLGLAIFWLVNNFIEQVLAWLGAIIAKVLGLLRPTAKAWQHRAARYGSDMLAALALFLLLLFALLPFYWVVITSFKTTLQITTLSNVLWPTTWTLEQYERLLGPERNFVYWYFNTLFVSLLAPLAATMAGVLGAYALARLRWRGSTTLSSFVLVTYLLPGVLLLIPLLLLFDALELLGSLWSLIVAYPSFTLPFALWMMMGYYTSIPEELESAALIDGCARFQVFYRIVLPLVKPALVAIFFFGVIHAWGEYLFASAFLRSEIDITLPVGLASMVLTQVSPWGEVSAASLLMSVPVVLLYIMGHHYMVEGLAAGAVKG